MEKLGKTKKKTINPRELALGGLFIALYIVGAYIKIPFPLVPITLQTLFVLLASLLLGPALAVLSIAIYIFLGLAGIPVFSTGGGLHYILTPTFGYLLGFLLTAWVVGGLSKKRAFQSFFPLWLSSLLGLVLIYMCGISYLFLVVRPVYEGTNSLAGFFSLNFLITLVLDLFKSLLATLLALKLRRILYVEYS